MFQSPNGDGKIQFLRENTPVTVFVQKIDYGITVIFEKINGNTVIQNLVRPPPLYRTEQYPQTLTCHILVTEKEKKGRTIYCLWIL